MGGGGDAAQSCSSPHIRLCLFARWDQVEASGEGQTGDYFCNVSKSPGLSRTDVGKPRKFAFLHLHVSSSSFSSPSFSSRQMTLLEIKQSDVNIFPSQL